MMSYTYTDWQHKSSLFKLNLLENINVWVNWFLRNTIRVLLRIHRRSNLTAFCIKEDMYLGMRVKSDTLGHNIIIELIKLTDLAAQLNVDDL